MNFLDISSYLILIIFLHHLLPSNLHRHPKASSWRRTKSSLVKWNFFFLSLRKEMKFPSIIRTWKMWKLCDVSERDRSLFTTFMHEILSLSFLFFCFSRVKFYAKPKDYFPYASPAEFSSVTIWPFVKDTLHALWISTNFMIVVLHILETPMHSRFWSQSYIFIY